MLFEGSQKYVSFHRLVSLEAEDQQHGKFSLGYEKNFFYHDDSTSLCHSKTLTAMKIRIFVLPT